VVVPVREEHGTFGDDSIKVGGPRSGSSEHRHRPATAENPGLLRMSPRVAAYDVEVLLSGARGGQVAAQSFDSCLNRVRVGVLETGEHEPSSEVDHLRVPTRVHVEVGFGHHRNDPAPGDSDTEAGPVTVTVEDVAVAEDKGGGVHAHMMLRNQSQHQAPRPHTVA
jgi:hypothetical protein